MKVHSSNKIKQLQKLRRKGHSIEELVSLLSIPKTSVWYHIRSVRLSPSQKSTLRSRQGGSAKLKELRWAEARQQASKLLSGIHRELLIILAMLYWAEGSKRACDFINSDGRMISLYLFILRKVLAIKNRDILPIVRIFSGMNENECLHYWSKVTNFPKDKFVVRLNDGGTRGRTRYGMCRISIRKSNRILKFIHSLINQVFDEVIVSDLNALVVKRIITVPS